MNIENLTLQDYLYDIKEDGIIREQPIISLNWGGNDYEDGTKRILVSVRGTNNGSISFRFGTTASDEIKLSNRFFTNKEEAINNSLTILKILKKEKEEEKEHIERVIEDIDNTIKFIKE